MLGNAPSLKELNLDFVLTTDTFVVNGAWNWLHGRKAKYYVVSDPFVMEKYGHIIKDANTDEFIMRPHNCVKAKELGFDMSRVIEIEYYSDRSIWGGGFQTQLGEPVYQGATVVMDAIQYAFQLGYTDVYVGGVDLCYKNGAYVYGGSPPPPERRLRSCIPDAFKVCQKVYKEHGRRIYKVTESPKVPLEYKQLLGVNT